MALARCLLTLSLLALLSAPARSGVHNPAEPPQEGELGPDAKNFQNVLVSRRQMLNDKLPPPLRKRALLALSLAEAGADADLTDEQRLVAVAYLIQLGQAQKALDTFRDPGAKSPVAPLFKSNLATAHQMAGQLQRGESALADALLRAWPEDWAMLPKDQQAYLGQLGWSEGQYLWYREAELFHLRYLRFLKQEQESAKRVSIAALFHDGGAPPSPLRFVGPSGKFEPGRLAESEKNKLPDRSVGQAIRLVQQLLLWLPADDRLYWLLGELHNANGDVTRAYAILQELERKSATEGGSFLRELPEFAELRDHYHALRSAAGSAPPPVVAEKAPKAPAPTPEEEAGFPWTGFLIGFASGALFTLFAYWQLRELARRRGRGAAAG